MGSSAPKYDQVTGAHGFKSFVVGNWKLGWLSGFANPANDPMNGALAKSVRGSSSKTLNIKADGTADLVTADGRAQGRWQATTAGISFDLKVDTTTTGSRYLRKLRSLQVDIEQLGVLVPAPDGQRLIRSGAPISKETELPMGRAWERLKG